MEKLFSVALACLSLSSTAAWCLPKVFIRGDKTLVLQYPATAASDSHLEIELLPVRCRFDDQTSQEVSIQSFYKVHADDRELIATTIDTNADGVPEAASQPDLLTRLSGTALQPEGFNELNQEVNGLHGLGTFGLERPSQSVAAKVWNFVTFSGGAYAEAQNLLVDSAISTNHASMAASKLSVAGVQTRVRQCVWKMLKEWDVYGEADLKRMKNKSGYTAQARFARHMAEASDAELVGLAAADSVMIVATVATLGEVGEAVGAVKQGVSLVSKKLIWGGVKAGGRVFALGNSFFFATESIRRQGKNVMDRNFWIQFAAVGLANFSSGFVTKLPIGSAMLTEYFVSGATANLAEWMITGNSTSGFFRYNATWGGVLCQPRTRLLFDWLPGKVGSGAIFAQVADQIGVNGFAFGAAAETYTDLPPAFSEISRYKNVPPQAGAAYADELPLAEETPFTLDKSDLPYWEIDVPLGLPER
jgi:hypothetical protein